MTVDFLGSGWAFPAQLDTTGGILLVTGDREIVESIRLVLGTAPGERPARPEFGCPIHDLVFAPADSVTAAQVSYHVRRALERWEPRIEVDNVAVDFVDASAGVLHITIMYRIRATNDMRNLVFPFYVIPAHEDGAE